MATLELCCFYTSADLLPPLSAEATFDLFILSSEYAEVEAERDEGRGGKGTNAKKTEICAFFPSQKNMFSSNRNSPEKKGAVDHKRTQYDRPRDDSGTIEGQGGRGRAIKNEFLKERRGSNHPTTFQTVTI